MNKNNYKFHPLKEKTESMVALAIINFLLILPYTIRVSFMGFLSSTIISPLLGWENRMKKNIELAMPDLQPEEKKRIIRGASRNIGKLLIEIFSPEELKSRSIKMPLNGKGSEILQQSLTKNRPVICVSGHFGNYDIFRAALIQYGFNVGALYRPMNNRYFNKRYELAIFSLGGQMFSRGRNGMKQMLQHLRKGNLLAVLIDQHMDRGASLKFFGLPAKTSLSAAQLALKYNALLIPVYAIRQDDGINFTIEVEEPIEHSNAEVMTQAINDSLERQIKNHPEQWLWTHRRWKVRGEEQ